MEIRKIFLTLVLLFFAFLLPFSQVEAKAINQSQNPLKKSKVKGTTDAYGKNYAQSKYFKSKKTSKAQNKKTKIAKNKKPSRKIASTEHARKPQKTAKGKHKNIPKKNRKSSSKK